MSRKPTPIDPAFEATTREIALKLERGEDTAYGKFNQDEYSAGLPRRLPDHVIQASNKRQQVEAEKKRLEALGVDPRVRAMRRSFGAPGSRGAQDRTET